MADKKNLLDRIKALFDNPLPTTYQLADGTEVSISLLDVGGDFTIGGAPAPAGNYTLQDGTGVVVDATGKITSVSDASVFAGTEYTLADGTKVSIDKMEAGGNVQQGNAPIANGEYTLEDGSKITTVDGVITVVTPKVAAAIEEPVQLSREQIQQMYDDVIGAPAADQTGKIVICVKALMDYAFGWQIKNGDDLQNNANSAQMVADAVNVYKQGFDSQIIAKDNEVTALRLELTKTQDTLKQALQLMTELAEAPSAEPPVEVTRKTVFNNELKGGKKDAISRYAEAAQKLHDSQQHVNN